MDVLCCCHWSNEREQCPQTAAVVVTHVELKTMTVEDRALMVWRQLWWCEDKSDVWRQLWWCEDNYDGVKTTMTAWRQLWWCTNGRPPSRATHNQLTATKQGKDHCQTLDARGRENLRQCRCCCCCSCSGQLPSHPHTPHFAPSLCPPPPPTHTHTTTTPQHICTRFLVMAGQWSVVMVD